MNMHIYVLVKEGEKIVEKYDTTPFRASKLRFDSNWYTARGDCIRHAIENGYSTIMIVVGSVEFWHRQLRCDPQRMHVRWQGGMWHYLDRLLCRYGHVYVPPLAWAKQPKRILKQEDFILNPAVPLVAGYQVRALQTLDNIDGPLGALLCSNGYDSFTVYDYLHYKPGVPVLDDVGSATTWRKSYERAIARVL